MGEVWTVLTAEKNPSTNFPSKFMLLPSSRLSCGWFDPSA